MEELRSALAPHRCIVLASNVLLHYFEAHPEFGPLARAVMRQVADGLPAITSVLTLLDSLVMPLRLKQPDLYHQHLEVLTTFPNLLVLPIDQAVVERAATLRARYPMLGTPDALTIATGLLNQASLYVTNEPRHLQLAEIKILNLRSIV